MFQFQASSTTEQKGEEEGGQEGLFDVAREGIFKGELSWMHSQSTRHTMKTRS
jgi:hypothetical protein